MAQTLQERYSAGLLARGYAELTNTRTKKYRVFEKGFDRDVRRVFVGKAGGVRTGASSSDSFPVSDGYKRSLLTPVEG